MICKVFTDVGGMKKLYHVCPPVRKIIHLLKLVDYLQVQADNPWYNFYLNMHAQLSSGVRDLMFSLIIHPLPFIVYMSSKGSVGETAHMLRLI